MLKFSKKAEYALLALQYMALVQSRAESNQCIVNTKEIAEEHHIPVELLAKVLQTLGRNHIIESYHNGPKGGYALRQDPSCITIAHVLEAVEGPLGITDCQHENYTFSCDQMDRCNIRTPMLKIQESIYQLLNGMSIQDMLTDGSPLLIVKSLKPEGVTS